MSWTSLLTPPAPTGAPDGPLPGRAQLLADLRTARRVRIELVVLRDADGLDPLMGESPSSLVAALREGGAAVYQLDGAAFVAVAHPDAASAAAAAQARHESMIHGEAVLPDDAATPERALDLAVSRLRARARLRRGSAERQVREVLMQLLAERGAGGRGAAAPQVAAHAVTIGRRLGMSLSELDVLARAAELQDLGRLLIPDRILNKEAPLTEEEWRIVERHPMVGERILAAAPALAPVARLVRSCAERYDGSGYPDRLAGEEIPFGARVIAVWAAFDAMTSNRPYRPALTTADALGELCRCAGRHFDPRVVAAFCAMLFEPA